mmetsp:Transcript_90680/g.157174  ORF Transcript_90680/g.157174 Transcript_90680/m.157174 type:complete len:83 (+) Transcript_90680:399-647(+)
MAVYVFHRLPGTLGPYTPGPVRRTDYMEQMPLTRTDTLHYTPTHLCVSGMQHKVSRSATFFVGVGRTRMNPPVRIYCALEPE